MEWQPIGTAPKDFTGILACARGADGRALRAIVHWGCAKHAHLSSIQVCHPRAGIATVGGPHCEMQWLGGMATRYGVEFTHWMPLPEAPY